MVAGFGGAALPGPGAVEAVAVRVPHPHRLLLALCWSTCSQTDMLQILQDKPGVGSRGSMEIKMPNCGHLRLFQQDLKSAEPLCTLAMPPGLLDFRRL